MTTASHAQRVLVVEDEHEMADWIAHEVRALGCAVEIAHDGPEALRATMQFLPDLILLDIVLPGMNGWEVARRVRRLAQDVPPRLVAISVLGHEVHVAQSAALGFETHLVKPIPPKRLAEIVRQPPANTVE